MLPTRDRVARAPGVLPVARDCRVCATTCSASASRKTAPQGNPVLLASAAGLARLAPNGLRRQHDAVNTACLKPKLVTLLAQVRRPLRTRRGDHVRFPLSQAPAPALAVCGRRVIRPARQPIYRCRAWVNGNWRNICAACVAAAASAPIATPAPSTSMSAENATGTGVARDAEPLIFRHKTGCHIFCKKPNFPLAGIRGPDYITPTARLRLSVRTPDFHSGKRGSIPLGVPVFV